MKKRSSLSPNFSAPVQRRTTAAANSAAGVEAQWGMPPGAPPIPFADVDAQWTIPVPMPFADVDAQWTIPVPMPFADVGAQWTIPVPMPFADVGAQWLPPGGGLPPAPFADDGAE